MFSHLRLKIKHLAYCGIFYCLLPIQLHATRASLPPESLQYQSFESYTDKKGGWYSDNIISYQINASPQAAFRGHNGVRLTGKADGELLIFRLPLNPKDGGARKIRKLLDHRGRFMLRSNCRGVVRYILKATNGNRLYSPWVAFHSSPSHSLKVENPDAYLTQTWSAHWQQIELPNFKTSSQVFETEDGKRPILNEEIEPYALDFRCRGDIGSFELHVDEFSIDIDHLMNYKSKAFTKMPLINVAGAYPRPSCLFSSPLYLNIDTKDSNSPFECRTNVFKETEIRWGGSEALEIQPRLPIHIASDQGVIGLRIGLRSSGTRAWKLKLRFSEEKLRQSDDGKEPHETFATHLPLDFRGIRHFEIPLCFTGLPLRPNYRLHNKLIDGSLKLESFIIEPVSGSQTNEDNNDLKLSFVNLEQWVEREIWESNMEAFPNQNYPEAPKLNNSNVQAWPHVLKDMESLDTFNSTFKHNEQTWVEEFDLNQTAAFRGRHGIALKLAPETKMTKAQDLQTTLYFKLSHTSSLNPEGEFQMSLRGRTTHTSRVSLWLKDDQGLIFSSPFETLSKHKSKIRGRVQKIEWMDFDLADASLKSYRLESKGPQIIPKLPFRPYALQVQVPKVNAKVNLHFDDLSVWTPISKPRLWRRDYRSSTPYFSQDQDTNYFSREIFSSTDAWNISHTYISETNWETGLSDPTELTENLNKAELSYRQAKEKLSLVKKLDPKSPKLIEDYFRDHQRSPIEGAEAKVLHFNTDSSGLELGLYWNEQKALNPWERWGCSGISLESALWNNLQNLKEMAWIPVAKGVVGMVLTTWSSAHFDTYLRLILTDERNRYFVRRIPLDQPGLYSHHLAFSNESFQILSKTGRRQKDQEAPQKLSLLRVEIEHSPLAPQHAGEQNLKLYPIKWLVDRKNSQAAFKG